MMKTISEIRSRIYDHFHGSKNCQQHFFGAANEDDYAAYYTAMYLLKDSTEGIWAHRDRGFSANPLLAYIEFWGVMQAVIIQQDCIKELHRIIVGGDLDIYHSVNWKELRQLRNVCAGHPVGQGGEGNRQRSFMGRGFGSYTQITIEVWQQANAQVKHKEVGLGHLINSYAAEAAAHLKNVFEIMQVKWP
jgi:hypothetical protein